MGKDCWNWHTVLYNCTFVLWRVWFPFIKLLTNFLFLVPRRDMSAINQLFFLFNFSVMMWIQSIRCNSQIIQASCFIHNFLPTVSETEAQYTVRFYLLPCISAWMNGNSLDVRFDSVHSLTKIIFFRIPVVQRTSSEWSAIVGSHWRPWSKSFIVLYTFVNRWSMMQSSFLMNFLLFNFMSWHNTVNRFAVLI